MALLARRAFRFRTDGLRWDSPTCKLPPSASALGEVDTRVAHSDTDLAPDGGGTYASRTAVLGGSAATMAADKIIAKAKKVAAHALEAAAAAYAPRRGGRGGIGQAFTEHLVYDGHSGQPLSGSLMDYGPPRADEVCAFEMDENTVPTKTNPLGVNGAGESRNVGALAAIMNAVVDALSLLGATHLDMPATPKKSGARSMPPEPAPDPDAGEAEPGQALPLPAGGWKSSRWDGVTRRLAGLRLQADCCSRRLRRRNCLRRSARASDEWRRGPPATPLPDVPHPS